VWLSLLASLARHFSQTGNLVSAEPTTCCVCAFIYYTKPSDNYGGSRTIYFPWNSVEVIFEFDVGSLWVVSYGRRKASTQTHRHTHTHYTHTHTHTHTRTHTRTCSKDARQVLLAHCRSGPAGVSSEPPPALPPPHTGEEISYAFFIAVAFLCSRYSLALIKRILQMHLHIKARALASEHTASLA
jgi:hypothetical protein